MALGFAGTLLFLKAVKNEDRQYFGQRGEAFYPINDDNAAYFSEKWQGITTEDIPNFVNGVLGNIKIWEKDLTKFAGFAEAVSAYLKMMLEKGVKETLAIANQ